MRNKFIAIILIQTILLAGIILYRQHWISTGDKVLLKTLPVDPWNMFRGDYMTFRYEISEINATALKVQDVYKTNDKVFVVLQKTDDGTYKYADLKKNRPTAGKFIQGRVTNVVDKSRWVVTVQDDTGQTQNFEVQWYLGVKKGDRALFCKSEFGGIMHYRLDGNSQPRCGKNDESFEGVVTNSQEFKEKIINVEYGIEHYFVEEGHGSVAALLEQQQNQGTPPAQQGVVPQRNSNRHQLTVEVALRDDGKGLISGIFIDGKAIR